jgi:hypothetical protein
VTVHTLTPKLVVFLEFSFELSFYHFKASLILGFEGLLKGVLRHQELGLALALYLFWLGFGPAAGFRVLLLNC